MATKPYPQIEETPGVADVYQVSETERESIMLAKEQFARGEFCSESEMDKMVAEWLRPHTMEELHAICDEAEADDEADRLLSSDFVHAEMERLNPWSLW